MSFEYTAWAWRQTGMTYLEKYTLLALADYADENGHCWPSVGGLAEKMGYSRESRKQIRKALAGLEERGIVSAKGRLREGTKEQTTHLYRIHRREEVGADNPHVGANSPNGGGYKPHEPVNEPITEPITSPTPSPLRADEEKNPIAIEHGSTASDLSQEENIKDQTRLKAHVLSMLRSSDHDYQEHSEEFIEAFESIHGTGTGLKDAGHMFWNQGYEDRLHSLASKAQQERGEQRGLNYGTAQWLSIFTNDFNS